MTAKEKRQPNELKRLKRRGLVLAELKPNITTKKEADEASFFVK